MALFYPHEMNIAVAAVAAVAAMGTDRDFPKGPSIDPTSASKSPQLAAKCCAVLAASKASSREPT